VSITSPADAARYARGQRVSASFACAEGAGGPGIGACVDQTGQPSGAPVDTSTVGRHTFTVTATSKDGLTGTASVTYTVAVGPAATISSPANGGTYVRGQRVATRFACTDGAGGPGIVSCQDSNRASGPRGVLDTRAVGAHAYTVTATSRDGQRVTATIRYRVSILALSPLRLKPRGFPAATRGPAVVARPDTGTTVSYVDSFAAHTTLRVFRCAGAHGGCGRLSFVGSFSHRDRAGTNRLRFTGRVRGRVLTPGRYVLRATARLAGQTSRAATARFVILAPPPACHNPDHDADCDPPGAGSSPRQAADTSDTTFATAHEHPPPTGTARRTPSDSVPELVNGRGGTGAGGLALGSLAGGRLGCLTGGVAIRPVVGREGLTGESGAGRC
jgi:hypothetical protein